MLGRILSLLLVGPCLFVALAWSQARPAEGQRSPASSPRDPGPRTFAAAPGEGTFRLASLPDFADVTPKPLVWIEPGTVVEKQPPRGWTHLILVAHTRVGDGDVQAAPAIAASIAQLFTVSVAAEIKSQREGERPVYWLDRVGIGIGTRIRGQNTIISSDTQAALGAGLGIIERQVLSTTEKAFVTGNRQVARTPTLFVFDADIVLLVDGEHKNMVTRYALLVSRDTGQLGALSWVLEPVESGGYRLVERPLQFLSVPTFEDRVLSVKADRFFFGIPAADAFAQIRPSSGQPLPWTAGLRAYADRRTFSADSIRQFERELWKLWGISK